MTLLDLTGPGATAAICPGISVELFPGHTAQMMAVHIEPIRVAESARRQRKAPTEHNQAPRSASAPRTLGCRIAGLAAADDPRQLDHIRIRLIWCQTIGSAVPGEFSVSQGRTSAGTL